MKRLAWEGKFTRYQKAIVKAHPYHKGVRDWGARGWGVEGWLVRRWAVKGGETYGCRPISHQCDFSHSRIRCWLFFPQCIEIVHNICTCDLWLIPDPFWDLWKSSIPNSSLNVLNILNFMISMTSPASCAVASSLRSTLARASVSRMRDSSCLVVMGVLSWLWRFLRSSR